MPMIYIWMHEGKTPEYKQAVSQGIHQAMVDVLKVPDDVYDQVFNEMSPGNMVYDRNYFNVPRSDDMIFVHFFFNTRPPALKAAFFEAVAREVTTRSGLRQEDLLMAITEMAAENWWAYGRQVDPRTGYDTRMVGQA